MSESDDCEDIPDAAQCQKLCEEFAAVTNTDSACAQFYLQDRQWDLQRSINAFYEDQQNKGGIRLLKDGEPEVVMVVSGSPTGLAAAAMAMIGETAASSRSQLNQSVVLRQPEQSPVVMEVPTELKFITWNIDGLSEENLRRRTKAVKNIIKREQADVVFLQEVVPETAEYLVTNMPDYDCRAGNDVGYFTMILLRKSTVSFDKMAITDFTTTSMMRNLLKIEATMGNIPLLLMTTHLESTAEHSSTRKQQLRKVFQEVMKVPSDRTVILGGDLNLRDKEVDEIGGVPTGLDDMWKACGSRKECSYTWDLTRNDNLTWNGKFKPRCRFDRVYLRQSSPSKVEPKHFGLVGLERLLPYRCFPSDHWGILCYFALNPEV